MADKILMAKQLRKAIQTYIQDTVKDESKMMEFADLYPSWEELLATKASYPAGTVFKYGNTADGEAQLWSFISEYVPQEQYNPSVDVSHYKKIGINEDGYPLYTTPYGQSDAYMKGDIVSYNGELWICEMDYCVWAPGTQAGGVTLWSKYNPEEETEPTDPGEPVEEPEEPAVEEYPKWVQPTSAVDSYSLGDIVSYEGKLYKSKMDGNAFVPTETAAWDEYIPESK